MPDIYHDVPIGGTVEDVFKGVSASEGLSKWWSKAGSGEAGPEKEMSFDFGPGYHWKAVVEEFVPKKKIVFRMTKSDDDWNGTRIKFDIEEMGSGSLLRFEHLGWPDDNSHYRTSSYCWAMYLRCLKMYIEDGTELDYSRRFEGFRNQD